jgi:addiction module HigA family antidote
MREDRHVSKSSTTTPRSGLLSNPHPGEILLEEFLKPMGLSQNALAREVHVAPRRINEIVLGKRDVTADTDLRLARYFGLSEGFFLGLQMDYDLILLRHKFIRSRRAAEARQQGHRGKRLTSASMMRRRTVAIEFGTWRSGRNGGSSGSVTVGYGKLREPHGGTRS